jgi:hypothetical protein
MRTRLGRFRWVRVVRIVMVFWRVRIGPFYLHKALGTDRLIATSRLVKIRWIIEETYWALGGVFV